ncbi:MAG TPA: hypothetical protein VIL09_10730 [Microvirga sp.]|jgi:hypothetical protein
MRLESPPRLRERTSTSWWLDGMQNSASKQVASEIACIALVISQVRVALEGLTLECAGFNPHLVNKPHRSNEDHV